MSASENGRNSGAADLSLLKEHAESRGVAGLRALADRHSPLVRSVCRVFLPDSPEAADDAARAVFLLLARESSSLVRGKHLLLAGWLHGAALLAARSVRGDTAAGGGSAGQSGMGLSNSDRATLHGAIHALPPANRESLLLGLVCGVGGEEAGMRMGLPQGEAKALQDKGLLKLARSLEAAGMDANEVAVAEWLDDEAKAVAAFAGKPFIEWSQCTPEAPLGPVSQKVGGTAELVAGRMAVAAAGRKIRLIAAAAAVLAAVAVAVVVAMRPDRNAGKADEPLWTARVAAVSGVVQAVAGGQEDRQLNANDTVTAGVALRADRNANLLLACKDGSTITLRGDTEVAIDGAGPGIRLLRGAVAVEARGRMTVSSEHVSATMSETRATVLIGKVGKHFTRIDVLQGAAACTRPGSDAARIEVRRGFAACFGEGLAGKPVESDGQEFAAAGGGVLLRSVLNEYEVSGLRLDQPRFAHMAQMWIQRGLDLDSHFSGSKTADAQLGRDENGGVCWTIRAAKGKESTEELIPIRAEGEACWVAMDIAIKAAESGPVSADLAGAAFVPESFPAEVKQAAAAGVAQKVEPMAKTTWLLKWALVGALPDGSPLYEYESSFGDGPKVKGWRGGAIEKTGIRFTGSEFRIYQIRGGVLEKAPVKKSQ